MSSFLLWLITLALFGVGGLGIFIPTVPGVGLIWVGVLVFAWGTQFAVISTTTVVVLGIVAAVAWLAEFVASGVATRLGGGGRFTTGGAVAGSLLGIIGGPVGIVVGAFVGALVGALAEGRKPEAAGRLAVLSVLGLVGAKLVQIVLAIAMVVAFFLAVVA